MLVPTHCRGLPTKKEKVTPAVGIKFTFEKRVFKNSTRYLKILQSMGGIRASLSGLNKMCRDCSNGDDNYEE